MTLKTSIRTFAHRTRELVLTLVVLVVLAQLGVGLFAAWDKTKPANNSALVSSEIRANWTSLETAFGNLDTNPLQVATAVDGLAAFRFSIPPTYKPGTDSAYDATISGQLQGSVDTTQHANSGTGLTDLSSYSLPANVLSANGKAIRCRWWGSFAANANNKSLFFKFGATTFNLDSGAINGVDWQAEAIIIRTGAATQKVIAESRNRPSGHVERSGTAAETLSGAVTIKTQATSGTASSDILQEGFFCEAIG